MCRISKNITRYALPTKLLKDNINLIVPNCVEGVELLKLLKIAWDRRLTFTVGTSFTSKQENVLVWNIPHKTAFQVGAQYGFPEDSYIKQVNDDLKAYNVE